MNQQIRCAALSAAFLTLAACGGAPEAASPTSSQTVNVAISPTSAALAPDTSQAFTAAATGATNTSVNWTVQEGSTGGTITSAGLYSAPSTTGTFHVVATSQADATKSAVATVVVADANAVWRPFSPTSPWNTPVPANPVLEANSAALIADLASSSPYGSHLDVNITGYSMPLYWADASTPTFPVLVDWGGPGWGTTANGGYNATATMPIPAGATPDPQSDHHLLVIDKQRGIEWGCWNMQSGSSGWHAGLCATTDLTGTGVRTPQALAQHWYDALGARASGFPLVAGLIRMEEVQAGHIDHALVIAYPHMGNTYTPPASTASAPNTPGGIPCGGRIQYDPSVNLDTLGLSPTGKMIMQALQTYGAYVGDMSGAISLYAENSPAAQAYWATGVLGTYELLGKIDLNKFRVIKFGTVYQ